MYSLNELIHITFLIMKITDNILNNFIVFRIPYKNEERSGHPFSPLY